MSSDTPKVVCLHEPRSGHPGKPLTCTFALSEGRMCPSSAEVGFGHSAARGARLAWGRQHTLLPRGGRRRPPSVARGCIASTRASTRGTAVPSSPCPTIAGKPSARPIEIKCSAGAPDRWIIVGPVAPEGRHARPRASSPHHTGRNRPEAGGDPLSACMRRRGGPSVGPHDEADLRHRVHRSRGPCAHPDTEALPAVRADDRAPDLHDV